MKLLIKVSLFVTLGALGVSLAIGCVSFRSTKQALQQAISQHQIEIARHTMDKIDRLLYERQKDIQAIAQRADFAGLITAPTAEEAERLSDLLHALMLATGPWDRLHVVRSDGQVAISSQRQRMQQPIRDDSADTEALAQALDGELYVSDHVVAKETGRPTVIFAVPVRDDRVLGQPVVGALMGYFAWPAVVEILGDVESHAVLLNAQGTVIGQNTRHLEQQAPLVRMERHALQEALRTRTRQAHIAPVGRSFLPLEALAVFVPQAGFLSHRGSQWGLLLETPARQAFTNAGRVAVTNALALMPTLLLGSAFLLWLIAWFVVRPIVSLTEIARCVAQGDLSRQAAVTSRDEIGELATTFNQMTRNVKESRDSLETRIAQRTAELSSVNAALGHSNRELDDFTYIVSHDLKEPLRGIDAFSKFALEECGPQLGADGQGYLERVRANAKRMQSLIDDLLAVSRLSRKANDLETVDLRPLLEDVRARFEYAITEQGVQLIVPEALPTLTCDPVRLKEVFANLISNAIKYHDKPVCRVEIGHRLEPNGEAHFTVQDNGPGIEPQFFDKVFQIFQRLGTREAHEGTGVGLTIVKKVVELHGGRIWVESVVGEGTTFHFTIPPLAAVAAPQQAASGTS